MSEIFIGRRYLAVAALCGFVTLQPLNAYAQPLSADAVVAQCEAKSETPQQEIVCLRNQVRVLIGGVARVATPEITSSASDIEEAIDREPVIDASAPGPLTPAQEQVLETAQEPTGLGAEQVAAREEKNAKKSQTREEKKKAKADKSQQSIMLDFAYTKTGQLILVLDNGQVWAQRKGDKGRVRLKDGETTPVTIRSGALSGYRIEFTEKHRTITAERIR